MVEEATKAKVEEKKPGWIVETCRFCHKCMYALHQRPKTNKQTGQQYLETKNVCPSCDYWVITRIPYQLARTISDSLYLPTEEEIKNLVQKQKEKAMQV
jgi:DNA-directed RNA polymerase subunit M/transcription elongation factor TFIIS